MRKRFYIGPKYKKYKYSFVADEKKLKETSTRLHVISTFVYSAFGEEDAEIVGAQKIQHLIRKLKKKDGKEGRPRIYSREFVEVV